MKKLFHLLLICGFLFTAGGASAQFGSVPGIVTDSFKVKYPSAKTVSWSSKIGGTYQATFTMENEKSTRIVEETTHNKIIKPGSLLFLFLISFTFSFTFFLLTGSQRKR